MKYLRLADNFRIPKNHQDKHEKFNGKNLTKVMKKNLQKGKVKCINKV